jgi:glycosyltransferase involved in cell wall biosynthesis
MLSPWALKQGRLRKRLVWCALQRRLLAGAAFIHATSVAESQDIRLAGVVSPVATVSNGLDIRNFEQQRVASFREHGRERIVLFVSRVHPKKGLDVLLTAWKQLGARRGSARLLIAGPGEARHVAELVQILSSEQIGAVEYIGPVDGDEKISLLSRAIAVVLPSWSENYGMVVAEALACGTPVITTYGVPWPQLESRRCGWRVNVTADELEMAIEEALANNEAELDSMGKRGREYVEQEHTVDAAAEKMEAAYDWARGLVNKPEFVT